MIARSHNLPFLQQYLVTFSAVAPFLWYILKLRFQPILCVTRVSSSFNIYVLIPRPLELSVGKEVMRKSELHAAAVRRVGRFASAVILFLAQRGNNGESEPGGHACDERALPQNCRGEREGSDPKS